MTRDTDMRAKLVVVRQWDVKHNSYTCEFMDAGDADVEGLQYTK